MWRLFSESSERNTEASTSHGDHKTRPPDILRRQVEEAHRIRISDSSNIDEDHTLKTFKQIFTTKIFSEGKGVFIVESRIPYAGYKNKINVREGQIIGIINWKMPKAEKWYLSQVIQHQLLSVLDNWKIPEAKKWYLSEVVYCQLLSVLKEAGKSISDFDLKSWKGETISNNNTLKTVEQCLPQGVTECTFEAGSKEFDQLAHTETAKSKFYLLSQHPEAFGKKQITSITVKRERNGDINIDYTIEQVSPSEPNKGNRASNKFAKKDPEIFFKHFTPFIQKSSSILDKIENSQNHTSNKIRN